MNSELLWQFGLVLFEQIGTEFDSLSRHYHSVEVTHMSIESQRSHDRIGNMRTTQVESMLCWLCQLAKPCYL